MNYLKMPAIAFSIMMSLSGAVNSGGFFFIPAVPFMALLVFLAGSYGKQYRTASLIFIGLCIFTSATRDWNPLFYPVLFGGTATVLQDGYHVSFPDGSGGYESEADLIRGYEYYRLSDRNSFETKKTYSVKSTRNDSRSIDITRIEKGELYEVTGVAHDTHDFSDHIDILTSIGRFSYSDFDADHEEYAIELNKPAQSDWSKRLGNLMYYPLMLADPSLIPKLFE